MMLRAEYYRNRRRFNPRRRRNVTVEEVSYEHPYEYMLYYIDNKGTGEPLNCPVCRRKVTKLFAVAHDEREAEYKFANNDCACGYDVASLIADEDMMLVDRKRSKR